MAEGEVNLDDFFAKKDKRKKGKGKKYTTSNSLVKVLEVSLQSGLKATYERA